LKDINVRESKKSVGIISHLVKANFEISATIAKERNELQEQSALDKLIFSKTNENEKKKASYRVTDKKGQQLISKEHLEKFKDVDNCIPVQKQTRAELNANRSFSSTGSSLEEFLNTDLYEDHVNAGLPSPT